MGSLVASSMPAGRAAQIALTRGRGGAKEERTPPTRPHLARCAKRSAAEAAQSWSGPALADFSGVYAGPRFAGWRVNSASISTCQGHRRKGPHHPRGREGGALPGAPTAPAGGGGALPAVPQVDFAKFGPIETVPLSRIKKISGPRLHASWVNIPHVTHTDEADITDLDAFRKALDEDAKKDKSKPYRVSLLPLLMRSAVASLKPFQISTPL